MDNILIRGIELWTRLGVPDSERASPQHILVDIWLSISTKEVSATDDVSKGIDYAAVTTAVRALAETERKTVERLAEDIATLVLTQFKPASVTVSVQKKPDLPVDAVCLTITRP